MKKHIKALLLVGLFVSLEQQCFATDKPAGDKTTTPTKPTEAATTDNTTESVKSTVTATLTKDEKLKSLYIGFKYTSKDHPTETPTSINIPDDDLKTINGVLEQSFAKKETVTISFKLQSSPKKMWEYVLDVASEGKSLWNSSSSKKPKAYISSIPDTTKITLYRKFYVGTKGTQPNSELQHKTAITLSIPPPGTSDKK